MAEKGFHYYYGDVEPNKNLSTWQVISETSCRLIGQPSVTWDNLGSLFFKHNHYYHIIDCLLDPDSNLFNVIQFCENNSNCVEIEIDRRKEPIWSNDYYSGHHIFASCPVDLSKLIGSKSGNNSSNVPVRWIHNYEPEQEASLDEFLKTVEDLETDPRKCGIVYKGEYSPPDTFEEHKHLSFILDLRRYCGDASGLNNDLDGIDTKEEVVEYVNRFHKNHVESNIPPTRQIVWTFLQTLWSLYYHCQCVDKSLDWSNVKDWVPDKDLQKMINAFQKLLPDLKFEHLEAQTTETEMIEKATDLIQKRQNEAALDQLIGQMKCINPAFQPTIDPVACPTFEAKFLSIVHQYTAFLEKKHFVQNADKLIEKIGSSTVKEDVVFAIYEQLIKTQIITGLKDQFSEAANILSFLFETVRQNGIVASITVPGSKGVKKKCIIVVNNVQENEEDLKQQLFDFVKDKGLPRLFLNGSFNVLFDNGVHRDLNLVDAARFFKSILTEENVDRIDGELVRERVVREKAAETWTEGVTAATRFLILSHVFLTHYYDNQDYQSILTSNSDKPIDTLMVKTVELLTRLKTELNQNPVNTRAVNQKMEQTTPHLFQLATKIEFLVKNMPVAIDHVLQGIKELNTLLSFLIESKSFPKQSSA